VAYFQICAATTKETTKAVPSNRTPKLPLIQRDLPYRQPQSALIKEFYREFNTANPFHTRDEAGG
jgi:hypothetical protein